VLLDAATAETWNKAPLTIVAEGVPPRPGSRTEEESLESIPAAPIRGTLAAFVMQPEVFRTLRLSCRRVGLDMRRHGRGEIPNPAAHRNEIVLMDVPPGEDRRFDWCRRIKELSDSTRVVLLIHHPSRHRVMQAFMSRADAIIGYPCDESQLSQKLGTMLDHQPSEPPIP
jgi:CheY-like chemotaxis protein